MPAGADWNRERAKGRKRETRTNRESRPGRSVHRESVGGGPLSRRFHAVHLFRVFALSRFRDPLPEETDGTPVRRPLGPRHRSGHFAQVKSYLKATGLHVGLLLNFNAPTLVVKRVVVDYKPAEQPSR